MRSSPALRLFFIFQVENILRSNYNLPTTYGCSSFIWLGEKNFTTLFNYQRGGRLSTPFPDGVDIAYVQTG